jgi:hypothetical protein
MPKTSLKHLFSNLKLLYEVITVRVFGLTREIEITGGWNFVIYSL